MSTLQISIVGSNEAQSAFASLLTDLHGVGTAAGEAQEKGSGFFSGMLQAAGGFLAANVIGEITSQFTSFIGDAIGDARDAAQLMAQTESVITSTGGAAGVTAQHIADVASALSAAAGQSLFGDDQIQQSENLLLTFTNIKGAVLDDATAISVDMAQALGGAPKDSAIQLGKALNDPIAGISALSRVGVTFDDQQKKTIETMVRAGDVAGAQGVILAELSKEFGGSAAAAAKADGGMAQFRDQIGELGESIGGLILPLLNQATGFLTSSVMPALQGLFDAFQTGMGDTNDLAGGLANLFYSLDTISPVFDTLGDAVVMAADVIGNLVGAFQDAGPLSSEFAEAIGYLAEQLGLPGSAVQTMVGAIQGGLRQVVAAFSDAKSPADGLLNVLDRLSPVFALIHAAVAAAVPPIQSIVTSVFGIIGGFLHEHGDKIRADLTGAWQQIQALISAVIPPIQAIVSSVFGAVATFLHAHGDDIKTFLGQTWNQIAAIVRLALELIQAIVVPILTGIAGFIQAHGSEIQSVLSAAWNVIKAVIQTALDLITGIIKVALDVVHGNWSQAWDDIKTMSATFVTNLLSIITSGLDLLKGAFDLAIEAVRGVLDHFVGDALGIGHGIIDGIVDGVKGGVGALIDAVSGAAQSALDAAKSALGIHSPSEVFRREIGHNMVAGMVLALDEGVAHVQAAAGRLAGSAVGAAGIAIGAPAGGIIGPMPAALALQPAGSTAGSAYQPAPSTFAGGDTYNLYFQASGYDEREIERIIRRVADERGRGADVRIRTGGY